jgi:hypothetical protein
LSMTEHHKWSLTGCCALERMRATHVIPSLHQALIAGARPLQCEDQNKARGWEGVLLMLESSIWGFCPALRWSIKSAHFQSKADFFRALVSPCPQAGPQHSPAQSFSWPSTFS